MMPNPDFDTPSDARKPKKRMGLMAGFSNIFGRKPKPANRQKSVDSEGRRASFSFDSGIEEYIQSSEFPTNFMEASAQLKERTSLNNLFRSSSFDGSHFQSRVSKCQSSKEPSKHRESPKPANARENTRPSRNDGGLKSPSPDKEFSRKQPSMGFASLDRRASLASHKEVREPFDPKPKRIHRVRSKDEFKQALDAEHTDDLDSPSTPPFECKILRKHIQETNDLVLSWLDSHEQSKKHDDHRESLRVLKDRDRNNRHTEPACRRSLDFGKTHSFSEHDRSRHTFEDSKQVRVPLECGGFAATKQKPYESCQNSQDRWVEDGILHDRKHSFRAVKDSQEASRLSLGVKRSANITLHHQKNSQLNLPSENIPSNIAEKPKQHYRSRSVCISDPDLTAYLETLPFTDFSRREKNNPAPSVIARLMGLDALPMAVMPETPKNISSNFQERIPDNQPHEVVSNMHVMQNYQVNAANSLDKVLQMHTQIQSTKGTNLNSIAKKQMLPKEENEMELPSEMQIALTQRLTKEVAHSTGKHEEDRMKNFAVPKHVCHADVQTSAKTGCTKEVFPLEEQTLIDGKPKHPLCKPKSKHKAYEDLENRIRKMQVQDSVEEHKTLKEILETMQLKGLLHFPSINQQQIIEEKHQDEKPSVEQGSRINRSTNSNVNVDGRCQDLHPDGHIKLYNSQSFSKGKSDSGDIKKSPIVLIKPLSGSDKSKIANLATDGFAVVIKSSLNHKKLVTVGEENRIGLKKIAINSLSKNSRFNSDRASESMSTACNSEKNKKVSCNQLYSVALQNSQEAYPINHKDQAGGLKPLGQFSPVENSKIFTKPFLEHTPSCLSENFSEKISSSICLRNEAKNGITSHYDSTSVCDSANERQKSHMVTNAGNVPAETDIRDRTNLLVQQKVDQSNTKSRECISRLEPSSPKAEIPDDAATLWCVKQEIKFHEICTVQPQPTVVASDTKVHIDSIKPSLQELALKESRTSDHSATLSSNHFQERELTKGDIYPEWQSKGACPKYAIQKELSQRPNADTANGDITAIPNTCETSLQLKHSQATVDFPERQFSLTPNLINTKLPAIQLQKVSTPPIRNNTFKMGLYQAKQNQQVPENTVGGCLKGQTSTRQEVMVTASWPQQASIKTAETLPERLQTEPYKTKYATATTHVDNNKISHLTDTHQANSNQKIQAPKLKNHPEALTVEHASKWFLAGALSVESDRPSPVSVLDSRFHEDEHLIGTTRLSSRNFSLEDSSSSTHSGLPKESLQEIQLLELGSKKEADNRQDLTGTVYAMFHTHDFHNRYGNTSKDHQEVEDSLMETDSGAFQWSQKEEIASIQKILEISEPPQVDLSTPVKFEEMQEQDPIVKEIEDEKIKERKLQGADCRLHSDCVNEIIAKNVSPFVDLQPWVVLAQPLLRKKPSEEQLVQQAKKEIMELPCLPVKHSASVDMLYTILEKDLTQTQWLDLKAEVAEIGLSLASLIFDNAVKELIDDLVDLTQGASRVQYKRLQTSNKACLSKQKQPGTRSSFCLVSYPHQA